MPANLHKPLPRTAADTGAKLELVDTGHSTGRRVWRFIAFVAVLSGVAGIGWWVRNRSETPRETRSEQPVTAAIQPRQILRLTGTTAAKESNTLRAPYLRGRRSRGPRSFEMVLEKLVEPGTLVKKGEIVAVFDRLSMRSRLDDYRAERVDAEHRLQTLAADLQVLDAAYRKQVLAEKAKMEKAALDLRTVAVRSAIQASQMQLAYDESKAALAALRRERKYMDLSHAAQLREVELEVREARVEEQRAEVNEEKLVAKAPGDGHVIMRRIFRGGNFVDIGPGDSLRPGHPYVQIVDSSSLRISAKANQVDIQHLRLGAPAIVRFDAYDDLELDAHISSIGSLARTSRWRGSYVSEVPVFLELDEMDPRVEPNLTVSVDLGINGNLPVRKERLESRLLPPATGDGL